MSFSICAIYCTLSNEGLSYKEVQRRFEIGGDSRIRNWERIYITEGPAGLTIERRDIGSTGRPRNLPKSVEDDLLAEVQRLRSENEHLKTCKPWLWKTSDASTKNTGSSKTEATT